MSKMKFTYQDMTVQYRGQYNEGYLRNRVIKSMDPVATSRF